VLVVVAAATIVVSFSFHVVAHCDKNPKCTLVVWFYEPDCKLIDLLARLGQSLPWFCDLMVRIGRWWREFGFEWVYRAMRWRSV
jgi:hypothetical protein